jgi:uncharacterized membrane protein YfcA
MLPMAASNAFGGWLGAKLAITKETALSEYFLVVVVGTLVGLLMCILQLKSVFGIIK